MPKKITTAEFTDRANRIHGKKYDYSKSKYIHQDTPLVITCPIHGEFKKAPYEHVSLKRGCTKCFFDRKRSSQQSFIKKSREVHGKKYDYSKVTYVNNGTDVKILCFLHGPFNQRPSHHMSGTGCPRCAEDNQKTSLESYVKRARLTHSRKYDYSAVKYINNSTKIKIACPKHGWFLQRPSDHVNGQGCPKCGRSRISRLELSFLDYIGVEEVGRQYPIKNTKYKVDGVDRNTNTVYEFLGDYWHGNPRVYSGETRILNSKLTCREVFNRTLSRFSKIHSLGYKIKYVWESDWKNWVKTKNGAPPIKEYEGTIQQ